VPLLRVLLLRVLLRRVLLRVLRLRMLVVRVLLLRVQQQKTKEWVPCTQREMALQFAHGNIGKAQTMS
jgi:hypothetical protein